MKLFCVSENDGDCHTWISARNPIDAILCYAEDCGVETFDGYDHVSIHEVDKTEAEKITLVNGLDETPNTLWEVWQWNSERGVICSSEY